MKNKICIITGATSGIGIETALSVAEKGATLILACRNLQKAEKVIETIKSQTGNQQVEALHCDLDSLKSIQDFVKEFLSKYERLDVLINNAGLFSFDRQETSDGFEKTFGANHLGPFYLTTLLLDLLKKSAPSRIINVASKAHYRGNLNFDDLQSEQEYKGFQAYSNSKLANVMFSSELARQLEGSGVVTNSLHPGVVATSLWPATKWYLKLLIPIIKLFMISPKEGAETTVYLAASDEVEGISGKYFDNKKEKYPSRIAQNVDLQKQLWEVSEQLINQKIVVF